MINAVEILRRRNPEPRVAGPVEKAAEISETPKFESIFIDKDVLATLRRKKKARLSSWDKSAKKVLEGPLMQDADGHPLSGEQEVFWRLPDKNVWKIAEDLDIWVRPKNVNSAFKVTRPGIFGERRVTPTRYAQNSTEALRRAIAELKSSFEPKKPEIVEVVLDPANFRSWRWHRTPIEKLFFSPFKVYDVSVITTKGGDFTIFNHRRSLGIKGAEEAAQRKLRKLQVRK